MKPLRLKIVTAALLQASFCFASNPADSIKSNLSKSSLGISVEPGVFLLNEAPSPVQYGGISYMAAVSHLLSINHSNTLFLVSSIGFMQTTNSSKLLYPSGTLVMVDSTSIDPFYSYTSVQKESSAFLQECLRYDFLKLSAKKNNYLFFTLGLQGTYNFLSVTTAKDFTGPNNKIPLKSTYTASEVSLADVMGIGFSFTMCKKFVISASPEFIHPFLVFSSNQYGELADNFGLNLQLFYNL